MHLGEGSTNCENLVECEHLTGEYGSKRLVSNKYNKEQDDRRSSFWKCLALGQLLSLMISVVGISSASLSDRGVSLPTTVNALNYLLLTCVYYLPRIGQKVTLPCWKYALFALVDVEANTMIVLAFRYTSITSVSLLDAFSIPGVMVLSYLFLCSRYTKIHLTGVGLCLCGLVLTVISDMDRPADGNVYPMAMRGDTICLFGALLYSCSNVAQEHIIKNHNREEFLGVGGLYATIFAGVQVLIIERQDIVDTDWTPAIVGFTMSYVVGLFLMYSWMSLFLKTGDAALFNLSLLTADVYSLLFAYIIEHASFNWVYFVAFTFIGLGLIAYHSQDPPTHAIGVGKIAEILPLGNGGGSGSRVDAMHQAWGGGAGGMVTRSFKGDVFVELKEGTDSVTDTESGIQCSSESEGNGGNLDQKGQDISIEIVNKATLSSW